MGDGNGLAVGIVRGLCRITFCIRPGNFSAASIIRGVDDRMNFIHGGKMGLNQLILGVINVTCFMAIRINREDLVVLAVVVMGCNVGTTIVSHLSQFNNTVGVVVTHVSLYSSANILEKCFVPDVVISTKGDLS